MTEKAPASYTDPTGPAKTRVKGARRQTLMIAALAAVVALSVPLVLQTLAAHLEVMPIAAVASPTHTPSLRSGADPGKVLQNAVTGVPDYGLIQKAKDIAAAASAPQYKDCAAVISAGKAPITIGSPGFRSSFDPDGDGIGCN